MPAHPSAFIGPDPVQGLRWHALEAERSGQLHPHQLHLIYEHGWFNLFVPKAYGGLQTPLPEALRLLEGLAWADGSSAWVVTLCSGAGWFSGFLEPGVCAQIWTSPQTCLAGSGAATGVAKRVEGGWEITGQWGYASGAPHASFFTFNATVEQQGRQLRHENGEPVLLTAWVPRHDVALIDTWDGMGMRATASHAFALQQKLVTNAQCFTIDPEYATHDDIVYRFPFLQLAQATLVMNLSGMALRFLDLADTAKTGSARRLVNDARTDVFALVEKGWYQLQQRKVIQPDVLQGISAVCRRLAQVAREQVNDIFPEMGMQAASRHTEINRVWRNFQTAGQHQLFR